MPSSFRESVPPVAGAATRPRWSVMIPTYNCAGYLRETLASVLAQDPGPDAMQIEVVDDCSTADDPEAVVRELGGGRVVFHRQAANGGHVRNFNTCVRRARGHLVHLLHGDDLVRPGFYEAMARPFDDPEVGAAFCRYAYIDERGVEGYTLAALDAPGGVLADAAALIGSHQPIQPPSIVVRRTVYERLGGYDARLLTCGEDWEMWVRIAAHYRIGHVPDVLALYRKHEGSLSGRSFRTAQNVKDLDVAIGLYAEYLPAADRRRVVGHARGKTARWAVQIARGMAHRGDVAGARTQALAALGMSHSPAILLAVARMMLRTMGRGA